MTPKLKRKSVVVGTIVVTLLVIAVACTVTLISKF